MITACGSGTGGNGYFAGTGNPSHSGGAGGEFCLERMIPVTPGGTLSITISPGGSGSTLNNPIAAAGPTTFGPFQMLGGKASRTGASYGGDGGGAGGGLSNLAGPPIGASSNLGRKESITSWGGPAGIAHNASGGPPGVAQTGNCGGTQGSGSGNVGSGGSGSLWAAGGNGGNTISQSGFPATG
jgi:hypothetical protein